MPKFTVTVESTSVNVNQPNARDAIRRAIGKIYGSKFGFRVSSDQFYTDPEAQTLHGQLTHTTKYGTTLEGRISVSTSRI